MHILITNDDGIRAEGLLQLTECAVKAGHRVTVCAPDTERSAASHSISITKPLRVKESIIHGMKAYAVDGTPADCARLGMYLLRNDRPDFCISGINRGPNLGGACIYSGTVGAAMEASMAGCPALAASLKSFTQNDYSAAARISVKVAEWAVNHPLSRGAIYNLNVPPIPYSEILGVRKTPVLAPTYLTEARYEAFVSEYNNLYYFLTDGENTMTYPEDSDEILCDKGWATVSSLSWDLSHKPGMDDINLSL